MVVNILIVLEIWAKWVECSPMVWETWVQSLAASYQRLLKWYLIPPCLTLSNIKYVTRVKWSNPEKGVAPSPTPRCSSYWKGSLLDTLDYGRQLLLLFMITRDFLLFIYLRMSFIFINQVKVHSLQQVWWKHVTYYLERRLALLSNIHCIERWNKKELFSTLTTLILYHS